MTPKPNFNFSAGPGVLPKPVLETAQAELLDFRGAGCSLMELSHRSPQFEKVLSDAESNLRTLLSIPSEYEVLFIQGGASLQFAAVVQNLIGIGERSATAPVVDYIITGAWSEKAAAEATKLGAQVNTVFSTKSSKHDGAIPPVENWKFSGKHAHYLFYCDNETIHGVEFNPFPFDAVPEGVPIVCDMSSSILSRPINVSNYGLIFAGAQKNMGPSGVTVVIIRKDLIQPTRTCLHPTPTMIDYSTFAKNKSMYNTPPTWSIYMCGLVFQWLLNDIGGLDKMGQLNEKKSQALYQLMQESQGFYMSPVVDPKVRSRMNIPFRICKNGTPSLELESEFAKRAEEKGLLQLTGHRSVGGMRASLYNAMTIEGVDALLAFMKAFANEKMN